MLAVKYCTNRLSEIKNVSIEFKLSVVTFYEFYINDFYRNRFLRHY